MGTLYICCSCDEHYGGDALACARSAGRKTPCGCDCHKVRPPEPGPTALDAARSIAAYCEARFQVTAEPLLDVPWFAEKVQAAIDAAIAKARAAPP